VTQPEKSCPFCSPSPERVLLAGSEAMALWDRHPLSPGHVLLITRRHIASWFEATEAERAEILRLTDDARQVVLRKHSPDGFNLGINDGVVAGQTVPHLHLHLIPRYRGDIPDPRGGVRWIIPDRAVYWTKS
jgi:diadenosine tetraphosphate (Ap4A) HIT family hydrolase